MSLAAAAAQALEEFERRHRPRCKCWRVDGLRQENGALVCAVCGRMIVHFALPPKAIR